MMLFNDTGTQILDIGQCDIDPSNMDSIFDNAQR